MVKLTDGEKLIATMLSSLMEHLEVESDLEPAFIKKQIDQNTEWAIAWEYPSLVEGDEQDPVVIETADILMMFANIECSIEILEEPDRSTLSAREFAEFGGFGQDEDAYARVASTFIDDLHHFQEFKGRDLHAPSERMLPQYRALQDRYREVADDSDVVLSAADLMKVLGCHRH